MRPPAYFLPQPPASWEPDILDSFERLYKEAVEEGTGRAIEYALSAPKWQFLCYLCDHKPILLHGSGNPEIQEFEPRKANDVSEFGDRRAVYAASDGIWAMFFAIVDRERQVTSLTNSCFRVVGPGEESGRYYFFSINEDALPHEPWRSGTVYLLPRAWFEQEPNLQYRGMEIEVDHWASPVAVRPLAKLAVEPADFPFLSQILPHDPQAIRERATKDPDGFPWLEE